VNDLFAGLRAALFDLDGTLIETHIDFELMRCEIAKLARRYDVDTPPPRDILTGVRVIQERLQDLGRHECAFQFRADAFAILQEIEVLQCTSPVEIEGAAELLDFLESRGVAVGIVTRNCRPVSEKLLAHARLNCRCLLTRDDVERTKPDPAHLLAALDALFATPTDVLQAAAIENRKLKIENRDCLMVGDHFMDVQAGRAAGMRTVGLLRGKSPSHFDEFQPDILVEGPADLLAMMAPPL
jgi:phosphoglycolate phosphatase